MNNIEFEKKLAENGFNAKEIYALRENAEKDGYPYLWLLSQLKKRFIGSCILLVLFTIIWVCIIFSGNRNDIISYSVTMIIVTGIIYIFTPMKTAFKAYLFLLKISSEKNRR